MTGWRPTTKEHYPPVVYGTSRTRTWGWYGWIRWPLSSDGLHRPGHRFPFRWMARLSARRMGRPYWATPATSEDVLDAEAGGLDPKPWKEPTL